MTYARTILFSCALLFGANGATAETGAVNVRNAGAFACAEVLPVLAAPERRLEKTAFLQWTAAYTTAAARAVGSVDLFPLSDTAELVKFVALVCRENETVNFETALRASLARLRPYRVRENREVIEIRDESGKTVRLYAASVRPLQADLVRYGARIAVDGVYGDRTGTAIAALNLRRGAPPRLVPDGALLYAMTRPRREAPQ